MRIMPLLAAACVLALAGCTHDRGVRDRGYGHDDRRYDRRNDDRRYDRRDDRRYQRSDGRDGRPDGPYDGRYRY